MKNEPDIYRANLQFSFETKSLFKNRVRIMIIRCTNYDGTFPESNLSEALLSWCAKFENKLTENQIPYKKGEEQNYSQIMTDIVASPRKDAYTLGFATKGEPITENMFLYAVNRVAQELIVK